MDIEIISIACSVRMYFRVALETQIMSHEIMFDFKDQEKGLELS